MKRLSYIFLILLAVTIGFNCAGTSAKPYNFNTKSMMQYYWAGDYHKALYMADQLVDFSDSNQSQDYYLTLLERGKIALAKGDYDQAIKDLQKAERHFLRIEGQISIEEEIGALFVNDLGREYTTEPYELLQISPYLALAYLGKNDFTGARVERNRTINKINEYIERSNKRHLENPFARYVSALIYEMEDSYQHAKIEYKKISTRNSYLSYFRDELKKINKGSTDLVVFVDVGLAPTKYAKQYGPKRMDYTKSYGGGAFKTSFKMTSNGQVVVVAFRYADLKPTPSRINYCSVNVNGKQTNTKFLYNLEQTIMKQFHSKNEERINKIANRHASHLVSSLFDFNTNIGFLKNWQNDRKKAMARADLRQWRTLPKNIQFCRLRNLNHGKQTVTVNFPGGRIQKVVNLKEKQVNVVYFAVPR